MIRLFTGQPGHGKTQRAIREGIKLAKEGRTVYAGNIKGLKHDACGFLPLADFKEWQSLPDGSVVIWDECYDAIKPRGSSAKVPEYIEKLATHRHRGFDFILIAQQVKQLDGFISGLIEWHWHFRRKFGSQLVVIKKWDQWQRDAQKAKSTVAETWRLDKEIWQLYESATVHTVKRHVPWYFYALPLVVIAVIAAALSIPKLLMIRAGIGAEPSPLTVVPQAMSLASRSAAALDDVDVLRRTEPMKLFFPRLEGEPWSAPAYDEVPFGPPPRLACIASEERCLCLTADQGTRYPVREALCRHVARYGRYDPTLGARRDQGAIAGPQRPMKRAAVPRG